MTRAITNPTASAWMSALGWPAGLGKLSVLLLALACFASGCKFTPLEPDPIWSEAEASLTSQRLALEVVAQAFESQGYPVGTGVNSTDLTVNSYWRTSLAPFRGKGYRKRAEARLEPLAAGRFTVRVHVQSQANMNLSDPLDPTQAEWEWSDEDPTAADILLQQILALIGAPFEAKASNLRGP